MHAEVRIGTSTIMLADDCGAEFGLPPMAEGRLPFNLQLYVPDADVIYAQALAAGATATMPLADQFWGDRYGVISDPCGISWAIATRQEDLTAAEIMERQAKAFGSATHA